MQEHSNRYYSLDFWRGLACLMIVAYHSSFYFIEDPAFQNTTGAARLIFRLFDHMWVGVPVFFVISGYCISAACDNARQRGFSAKKYFQRRLKRIIPPYWTAMLFLLAVSSVLLMCGLGNWIYDSLHPMHSPGSLSITQWLGNISLTEIWRHNVIGDKSWFFLGPAWSLCYEEQFYFVCGLLLFGSSRHFFSGCALVTVAVCGITTLRYAQGATELHGFFWDGRWLEFAIGIGLYYAVQHARERQLVRWGIGAAFIMVAVVSFVWWKHTKQTLLEEMFVAAGFAAMAQALFRFDLTAFTGAAFRPIWLCGTMCYSLYLTHGIVVKLLSHLLAAAGVRGAWMTLFITVPVCVVAAGILGWFFHLLVERRFLNTPPLDISTLQHQHRASQKEAVTATAVP